MALPVLFVSGSNPYEWITRQIQAADLAIASGAIQSGNLGASVVYSGNFASGQISAAHISSGTIVAGAGISVTANANNITITNLSGSFALASGIITSGMLGDFVVNTNNLNSGSVDITKLVSGLQVSGLVLSGGIGSGQISAAHISSGTIIAGTGISVTANSTNITITSLSGGGGTVVNVNAARGTRTASGNITTSGVIWGDEVYTLISGFNATGYTLQDSDRGKFLQFDSTLLNLPVPGGASGAFANGWYCDVQFAPQIGVLGSLQLSPASGTQIGLNNPTNIITPFALLDQGNSCRLVSDGTNWQMFGTADLAGAGLTKMWFSGGLNQGNPGQAVLSVRYGTTANTATQGNDVRLLAPGFIYGFNQKWFNSSGVTIGFTDYPAKTSICRDNTDSTNILLSGAVTCTTNVSGAGGMDLVATAGTSVCRSGLLVSGTGTNYLTMFPTRSLGAAVSASGKTLVGFSGTNFASVLGQVSPGDLIGGSSGYYMVQSVQSGLITLVVSGAIASGFVPNIIENASFGISGQFSPIWAIYSNTSMMLPDYTVPGVALAISGTAVIGGPLLSGLSNLIVNVTPNYFSWVGVGNSGTTCFISTQRTTPIGMAGYNTSLRRVGSISTDIFGYFVQAYQHGTGNERTYTFSTFNTTFRSVGASQPQISGTWTAAIARGLPATSDLAQINIIMLGNLNLSGQLPSVDVDARYSWAWYNATGQGNNPNRMLVTETGANNLTFVPTDAVQNFAWKIGNTATSGTITIDVAGYKETV